MVVDLDFCRPREKDAWDVSWAEKIDLEGRLPGASTWITYTYTATKSVPIIFSVSLVSMPNPVLKQTRKLTAEPQLPPKSRVRPLPRQVPIV